MTGYSSTTAAPPESSNGEAASTDTRTATGISMMKGEDDPPIGPPEDYPLWLRNLAEAPSSLGQLTRADEDALSNLEVRHTDATDAFAILNIVTAADSGFHHNQEDLLMCPSRALHTCSSSIYVSAPCMPPHCIKIEWLACVSALASKRCSSVLEKGTCWCAETTTAQAQQS